MPIRKQQGAKLAKWSQRTPASDDFEVREADVPTPGDGLMPIPSVYLSSVPVVRSVMEDGKSDSSDFEIGQALTGVSMARAVTSRYLDFTDADDVCERLAWQHFPFCARAQLNKDQPRHRATLHVSRRAWPARHGGILYLSWRGSDSATRRAQAMRFAITSPP